MTNIIMYMSTYKCNPGYKLASLAFCTLEPSWLYWLDLKDN